MQLSDRTIRALRPREKPYKLTDGNGLYLLVTTVGGRLWRYDYRFQGKRQTLSLGQYPDLGLAAARQTLAEARQALAEGRDPMRIRRSHKPASGDTFGKLSDDWLQKRIKEGLADPTIEKLTWFIDLARDDLGHIPSKKSAPPKFYAFCAKLRPVSAIIQPSGYGPRSAGFLSMA
jgi:hypothetical protein